MSTAGCLGKIGYPTRAEAKDARRRISAKPKHRAERLDVYHCHACGRFHLGRNVRAGRPDRIRDPHGFAAKAARYWALVSSHER